MKQKIYEVEKSQLLRKLTNVISMRSILVQNPRPMNTLGSKKKTGSKVIKVIDYQKRKKPVMKFAANSGWELDEDEMANDYCDFDIIKILKNIRDNTNKPEEIEKDRDKFLHYIDNLHQEALQGQLDIDEL